MINKSQFSIKNDKKVLRKKGKSWIVVSALLLGLVGGASVMASTTAVHASSVQPQVVSAEPAKSGSANATKPSAVQSQASDLHKALMANAPTISGDTASQNVSSTTSSSASSATAKSASNSSAVSSSASSVAPSSVGAKSSARQSTTAQSNVSSSAFSAKTASYVGSVNSSIASNKNDRTFVSVSGSKSNRANSSASSLVSAKRPMMLMKNLKDDAPATQSGSYDGLSYKFYPSTKTLEFTGGTLSDDNANTELVGSYWDSDDSDQSDVCPKNLTYSDIENVKFDKGIQLGYESDLSSLFQDDTNLQNITGLSDWNVSNVTNLHAMFRSDSNLNPNVLNEMQNWQFNQKPKTTAMVYGTHLHDGKYVKSIPAGQGKYMLDITPVITKTDTVNYVYDGKIVGHVSSTGSPRIQDYELNQFLRKIRGVIMSDYVTPIHDRYHLYTLPSRFHIPNGYTFEALSMSANDQLKNLYLSNVNYSGATVNVPVIPTVSNDDDNFSVITSDGKEYNPYNLNSVMDNPEIIILKHSDTISNTFRALNHNAEGRLIGSIIDDNGNMYLPSNPGRLGRGTYYAGSIQLVQTQLNDIRTKKPVGSLPIPAQLAIPNDLPLSQEHGFSFAPLIERLLGYLPAGHLKNMILDPMQTEPYITTKPSVSGASYQPHIPPSVYHQVFNKVQYVYTHNLQEVLSDMTKDGLSSMWEDGTSHLTSLPNKLPQNLYTLQKGAYYLNDGSVNPDTELVSSYILYKQYPQYCMFITDKTEVPTVHIYTDPVSGAKRDAQMGIVPTTAEYVSSDSQIIGQPVTVYGFRGSSAYDDIAPNIEIMKPTHITSSNYQKFHCVPSAIGKLIPVSYGFKNIPKGYHVVNPSEASDDISDATYGEPTIQIRITKNATKDNIIKGTAHLHLVYKETNGNVDATKDVNIPINSKVGDKDMVISPWKYSRSFYGNRNKHWVIPMNQQTAEQLKASNNTISHTFTYVGKTAGDLKVQYVDADQGAKAMCHEGVDGDGQPIVGTQDLGSQGVVGQKIVLGQQGANDKNGVRDLLVVPKGWKLVNNFNTIFVRLSKHDEKLTLTFTPSTMTKPKQVVSSSAFVIPKKASSATSKAPFAKSASSSASDGMQTLNFGTKAQQGRAWNFVQHGIHGDDFDPNGFTSANSEPASEASAKAKSSVMPIASSAKKSVASSATVKSAVSSAKSTTVKSANASSKVSSKTKSTVSSKAISAKASSAKSVASSAVSSKAMSSATSVKPSVASHKTSSAKKAVSSKATAKVSSAKSSSAQKSMASSAKSVVPSSAVSHKASSDKKSVASKAVAPKSEAKSAISSKAKSASVKKSAVSHKASATSKAKATVSSKVSSAMSSKASSAVAPKKASVASHKASSAKPASTKAKSTSAKSSAVSSKASSANSKATNHKASESSAKSNSMSSEAKSAVLSKASSASAKSSAVASSAMSSVVSSSAMSSGASVSSVAPSSVASSVDSVSASSTTSSVASSTMSFVPSFADDDNVYHVPSDSEDHKVFFSSDVIKPIEHKATRHHAKRYIVHTLLAIRKMSYRHVYAYVTDGVKMANVRRLHVSKALRRQHVTGIVRMSRGRHTAIVYDVRHHGKERFYVRYIRHHVIRRHGKRALRHMRRAIRHMKRHHHARKHDHR